MAAVASEVRVLGGSIGCPATRRPGRVVRQIRPRYGLRRAVVVLALLAIGAMGAALMAAVMRPAAGAHAVPPVATAPTAASTPRVPGWVRASAAKAVVVAPGDTVWELALAHRPPAVDAADWVARVVHENRVDAAALRPGAVLRLPAGAR